MKEHGAQSLRLSWAWQLMTSGTPKSFTDSDGIESKTVLNADRRMKMTEVILVERFL